MGRHAAEVSDLDRIVAEFECVDSDAIHLFTDQRDEDAEAGANPHNNFDPAYKFIPPPVRHRKTPDGKRYKPNSDPGYVAQMEANAKSWSADIEGTDEQKLAVLAENVDGHTSTVLPATEAEVPARLGVPFALASMASFALGLMCQFLITIAQGGVS